MIANLSAPPTGHGLVEDMTLAEIQSFDAGIAMGPEFKGETVPTLQQVMELVNHQTALNIEIKAGRTLYPGIVDRILEVISAYRAEKEVVISSFHKGIPSGGKAKGRGLRSGCAI